MTRVQAAPPNAAAQPAPLRQHLQLLRRTGLVGTYRVGKKIFCRPSDLATLLTGG